MEATTKLSCIVILFATLFSTACKKETAEKPGSKPLETFISSNTEFDVYEIDDFPRTMTIIFKTTKAGKITHLGAKLESGTYNVALIDSSSQATLRTTTVTVTDSANFAYTDIDDVDIIANKMYYVSVNNATTSNSQNKRYFTYNIIDGREFPITDGNFTYLEPIFNSNTTSATDVFEGNIYRQSNSITGIPGFIFSEN